MNDARRPAARWRPLAWLAGGLAGALALPVATAASSGAPRAAGDAGPGPVGVPVPHHGVVDAPPGAAQPRAAQSEAAPTGAASTAAEPRATPALGEPTVRLAAREPGAPPNDHPARLAPAALRAALQRVTVQAGAEPGPLFGARELDALVGPLADALARATPGQDVIFAVGVDPSSASAPRRVTSARLFRRERQLQLIVGRARQALEARDATGAPGAAPHELRPGRRTAPLDPALRLAVAAGGGSLERGDWVSLVPGPASPRTTGEPAIAPRGSGLRPGPAGG